MTDDQQHTAAEVSPVAFRLLPPDDPSWDDAFPVLAQLRPHLDRAAFDAVFAAGREQGLIFTGAFDPVGRCLGVAGWRVVDTTSVVRKLYVDDLVVDASARSTGVGAALLDHLEDLARAHGCPVVELDSGHQRVDAHRFYVRQGYEDAARHFRKVVLPER